MNLRTCKHPHQTLVSVQEVIEDTYFDFIAYQCDDCGLFTPKPIEPDAAPVANYDAKAYNAELSARIRSLFKPANNAMRFMAMATKRG